MLVTSTGFADDLERAFAAPRLDPSEERVSAALALGKTAILCASSDIQMGFGHIHTEVDNCFFHGLNNSCLFMRADRAESAPPGAHGPSRSNNCSSCKELRGCGSNYNAVLLLRARTGVRLDLAAVTFFQHLG